MMMNEILRAYVRTPCRFAWGGIGGEDCTTWCGAWALRLTGQDPARTLRGTYASKEEADALVARAGGLFALVNPLLRQAGWLINSDGAMTGDMGLIETIVAFEDGKPVHRIISALRFGPLWVALGETGVAGLSDQRARSVASWSYPE